MVGGICDGEGFGKSNFSSFLRQNEGRMEQQTSDGSNSGEPGSRGSATERNSQFGAAGRNGDAGWKVTEKSKYESMEWRLDGPSRDGNRNDGFSTRATEPVNSSGNEQRPSARAVSFGGSFAEKANPFSGSGGNPSSFGGSSGEKPNAYGGRSGGNQSSFGGASGEKPNAYGGRSGGNQSSFGGSSGEKPNTFGSTGGGNPSSFGGSFGEKANSFGGGTGRLIERREQFVGGERQPDRGSAFNNRERGGTYADREQPPESRSFNRGSMYADREPPTESKSFMNSGTLDGGERKPVNYTPAEYAVDELYEETRIEKGVLFEKFFEAQVKVTSGGAMVNGTVYESFEQVNLTPQVARNVQRAGYTKLTPIQKYGMPWIVDGVDMMACAQTGSGKTAAFLLPIMSSLLKTDDCASNTGFPALPRCIIVAPTRELARQIYNEARKFGNDTICTAAVAYGGTSVRFQSDRLLQGASIVVGTIGRLCQYISEGTVSLKKVRFMVVDEADRMLDMGFKDSVSQLLGNTDYDGKQRRQTLMFSATFPAEVQHLARQFLANNYVMVAVDVIGAANKCVVQEFLELSGQQKKDKLLEVLNIDTAKHALKPGAPAVTKKTLVFVNTKRFADILAGIILQSGLKATTIHGDREQREREIALGDFRAGRSNILIATGVAERGLDINNVDHVINYDLPSTRDEYVHRIGRTGRVGNPGLATSFVDPDKDRAVIPAVYQVAVEAGQVVPEFMQRLAGVNTNYGFGGRTSKDFTQADGNDDDWN